MKQDQMEQDSAKKVSNKGLLAASVISWIIVVALITIYSYSTTLENFRSEQFALRFLADLKISVDFPIFMYFIRVFCYALLTAFAYAAIDSTAHLKFAHQAKSYMKLLFFRVSVSEAITFWFVVFFSSCIEYFLLFVPGHAANILHFMQNLFGVALALVIIRIVKLIARFFRFLFRKKN